MKIRRKTREASYLKERIKEGYIVMFFYRDRYMKLGKEFEAEDVYTLEETRYVGLMTNEAVGTCNGEGEAVVGFSKDFRKQIGDCESIEIMLYKDLPQTIKNFYNKEVLRGDENEEYNKRRTATI